MDAFAAIADPIRREILDLLRREPLEAGAIASRFPVSRPAISRHLRVLREAGLVAADLDGRRWVYRVQPEALAIVATWLAPFRAGQAPAPLASGADVWSSRLDALTTEVFRTRREREQARTLDKSAEQEQSA